jgi:fluoroquinolone resistance protein
MESTNTEINIYDLTENDCHDSQTYSSVIFNKYDLTGHTFENCIFESCHFIEMPLSDVKFLTCSFSNSELVSVKIDQAILNTIDFIDCKIMGLNFGKCGKFGFFLKFKNCIIENTVFESNNLKKGEFKNCSIRFSDFSECDIREADFTGTEFERTTFHQCNLEKTDFRTARNYTIDPFNNKIKKAKFSLPEAQSFLGFLNIDIKD